MNGRVLCTHAREISPRARSAATDGCGAGTKRSDRTSTASSAATVRRWAEGAQRRLEDARAPPSLAAKKERRYASDSDSDSLSDGGGRSPGGRGTYGTMAWMQQIVLGLEYEANGVFAETHSSGMVPVRSM